MAAPTNTIVKADIEPAISIDHTNRLVEGIKTLQKILGIAEMTAMGEGAVVKQYKVTKKNTPAQVGEGETIALTKIERKLANTYEMTLKKYRKSVTAEAIQKSGYEKAVNDTDEKLIAEVRKDIKADFFTMLGTGTGTASGTNLQKALAALWGKLQVRFEDMDVTPVFFINPTDVADYLGDASISTQNAFGFSYVENFLGLGDALLSASVPAKAPMATVKENMNGVYIPTGGDLARAFGLTVDESGLVGMMHDAQSGNASLDTLVLDGVLFYPEEVDGVFKGTIGAGA